MEIVAFTHMRLLAVINKTNTKKMKITLLFILFFVSLNLCAQSKPIESIPFKIEVNHIFIYVKVNETDSLKFLFDTGADGSVINLESLNKLTLNIDGKTTNIGSNGTNEVEKSTNNEMIIGTIHKKEIIFTIIPYETDEFDGVFGIDLMIGHIIEIDYHNQVINFYAENDKDISYEGYTKLKMYNSVYPTCIKSSMLIRGKKYEGLFGLDTGASDALTLASPYAKKNDFINKMTKIGSDQFQGSDGSIIELSIVLCPEVEFAEKHFYRVPTALSTSTEGIDASDKLAGFYGNAFLKKFNMIIDYNNKLIYFRINKNLYTEF